MDQILDPDFEAAPLRWQGQEQRILRGYGLRPYDVRTPINGNPKPQPQQAAA